MRAAGGGERALMRKAGKGRACTWRQTSRPMRPKPLMPMETLRLGALATVATVREAVAMANMLAERFRRELVS